MIVVAVNWATSVIKQKNLRLYVDARPQADFGRPQFWLYVTVVAVKILLGNFGYKAV